MQNGRTLRPFVRSGMGIGEEVRLVAGHPAGFGRRKRQRTRLPFNTILQLSAERGRIKRQPGHLRQREATGGDLRRHEPTERTYILFKASFTVVLCFGRTAGSWAVRRDLGPVLGLIGGGAKIAHRARMSNDKKKSSSARSPRSRHREVTYLGKDPMA